LARRRERDQARYTERRAEHIQTLFDQIRQSLPSQDAETESSSDYMQITVPSQDPETENSSDHIQITLMWFKQ